MEYICQENETSASQKHITGKANSGTAKRRRATAIVFVHSVRRPCPPKRMVREAEAGPLEDSMKPVLEASMAVVVMLLFAASAAWAQATAQLNGRVTDESSAVLPA
jgi:hypothetical protein